MGWVYLDDRFPEHPKIEAAGGDAAWLFVCGLAYTNRRNAFDGLIPKTALGRLSDRKNPAKLAGVLVKVGLWHDEGDRYRIHDYEIWNEKAMRRRAAAKKAADARWHAPDAPPLDMPPDMRPHGPPQSDGIADADADAMHIPKPHPHPSSSSSVVNSRPAPPTPDDDDRDLVNQAIDILAKRDLQARITEKGAVRSTPEWLTEARRRRRNQHKHLLGINLLPFADPQELADWLDPPTIQPTPTPTVADTETRRQASRAAAEACGKCEHGWLTDTTGAVTKCECQQPVTA